MATRKPKVEVLRPVVSDLSKQKFSDVVDTARGIYTNAELMVINCRRKRDGKVVDLLAIVSTHDESGERRVEPVAEILGDDAVDLYDPPDTRSKSGFRTRGGRSLG